MAEIFLIIGLVLVALPCLILLAFLVYKLFENWQKKASKIMPKNGCFRQSPDCRHPREYLCIKCGDCGRKFIK